MFDTCGVLLGSKMGSCGENGPSALSLPEAIQVPRCHARGHALCYAPKIHTHLHEGLLDVVIRIARQ